MAPNHSEEPESTESTQLGQEAAFGGLSGPVDDPAANEVPADTGSIALSLLVEPAVASDEVSQPLADLPVLPDADQPPTYTSELARRWLVRQDVGGMAFVASTPLTAARDLAEAAAVGGVGEHVHLANAYSVSLANEFPALAAETFCADGWNLPDGRPISWLSHLRGDRPELRQVRGPQFMLDVCEVGVAMGLRHYLLGGTPEVLARLETSLRDRFPGIDIVGSSSPPFREPSAAELAERDTAVVSSGAQVVWVGLGTPKQDREVVRLARSTGLVAVAVGAAFDFAAGTLREAPVWMRRIGLEWLFRLIMEPRRLWRRYLIGNVHFLRVASRRRARI